MIGIGIDTGGTCTDAVVFDITERCILASAKSQTTHDHLEQGIGNSLDKLPKELLHQASFLALSTTLATNACVENKGGRVFMIFIGVSEVDYSGYIDCREEFIRAMENTINLGTVLGAEKKCHITIHAPFMHMTKADEVRLGTKLGVDFGLTWTCYRGGEKPCGTCDSCLLRSKAFAEAGIEDPLTKL